MIQLITTPSIAVIHSRYSTSLTYLLNLSKFPQSVIKVNNNLIKKLVIEDYSHNMKTCDILIKYKITKTTLYRWINNNKINLKSETKQLNTTTQYNSLKNEFKNVELKYNIVRDFLSKINITNKDKLVIAERLIPTYPLKTVARVIGIPSATLFHHINNRTKVTLVEKENEKMKIIINELFAKSEKRLSYEKMHQLLKSKNINCSLKRVSKLMKELNLKCINVKINRKRKELNQTCTQHLINLNKTSINYLQIHFGVEILQWLKCMEINTIYVLY